MLLLNGRLELHDIADVEAFAFALYKRSRLHWLRGEDRDELVSYLIEEAWRLSLVYDGSRGSRFSAYARSILQRRLVDWQRTRYGRSRWQFSSGSYERPRPEFVPLAEDHLVDEQGLENSERIQLRELWGLNR